MNKLVICGTGGTAKELTWLIEDINKRASKSDKWNLLGYLDKNENNHGKKINGYKVLGGDNWIEDLNEIIYIAMGIGDPVIKYKLDKKFIKYENTKYPTLIHPDVKIHNKIKIQDGTIIFPGVTVSVNSEIGRHVFINFNSTISHDTIINDFSTVSPGVNVAGNVMIDKGVFLGINSTIIQNLTVNEWSKIGAGAVVISDIQKGCVAAGVPAKVIKENSK